MTCGLAEVANELETAVNHAEEMSSKQKRAMLASRNRSFSLLKRHLGANSGSEEP